MVLSEEAPKKEKESTVALQPSKGGGVELKKAEDVPGWYLLLLRCAARRCAALQGAPPDPPGRPPDRPPGRLPMVAALS